MSKKIKIGSEVKYKDFDEVEGIGIVRGIQTQENEDHEVVSTTYIVDTGEDERVDIYHRNPRQEELGARLVKHLEGGMDYKEAHEKLAKEKGLPKDEVIVEEVRQPKDVIVPEHNILEVIKA